MLSEADLPVETLTAIFSTLSYRDLNICRGVSHRWRNIIDTESPSLKKALFSMKETDAVFTVIDTTVNMDVYLCYHSNFNGPGWTRGCLHQATITKSDSIALHPFVADIPSYAYLLNPNFVVNGNHDILCRHTQSWNALLNTSHIEFGSRKELYEKMRDTCTLDSLERWKDIFVSEPPIRQLSFQQGENAPHVQLINDKGVRLSQFLAFVHKEVQKSAWFYTRGTEWEVKKDVDKVSPGSY